MIKSFCLLIAGILLMNMGCSQVIVKNPRCENRINPLGIDIPNPRFSWQLVSDQRNLEQTAYEIRVGYKSVKTGLWSSGKIMSSQSIFVPYNGKTLESGE